MTDESKARAHVLVVEDDATVGPLIVRMLEAEGYTVVAAGDGREGLEFLLEPLLDIDHR